MVTSVATIGYEGTTVREFLDALAKERVELLVDVRAVASSRRPGFAKTRLAGGLAEAGIEYLHLRGLGTPADGRAAARAGRHSEMREIFSAHMESDVARTDFDTLVSIVEGGRRACLMCFEADAQHCHRLLVADALQRRVPNLEVRHLTAEQED